MGIMLWGSPWTFAATLLAILVVHESGHYLTARLHHVRSSLPYFLPLPLLNPFGTLGAVILMPDRIRSRRALLDIGAAGPLAGMAAAVPLMLYGLSLSEVGPRSTGHYVQEGQCILYWALKYLVHGAIPADHDVYLHPVALAAWGGFLVTFVNLLPVGQLDGGHVAYALLGERQNRLARWLLYVPAVLFFYNAWVFLRPTLQQALAAGSSGPLVSNWHTISSALLIWLIAQLLLLGLRRYSRLDHPPVDDLTLSPGRKAVGIGTLLLFILLFMPSPWVAF
jgi:membrane-associated protease RseP (regulator of RpoE activity)